MRSDISADEPQPSSALSILFGYAQIKRGRLARDFAALQRAAILRRLAFPAPFSYAGLAVVENKLCEICEKTWRREVGSGKRLCPACAANATPLVPECLGLFSAMRPRTRGGYGL